MAGRVEGVRPDEDCCARLERAEQALREIRQLVEYEWRLKRHSAALVVNTIEQVLAALDASTDEETPA